MIFTTMINPFYTNEPIDELSVSIYSDKVDSMFKCGEYTFTSGDILDF